MAEKPGRECGLRRGEIRTTADVFAFKPPRNPHARMTAAQGGIFTGKSRVIVRTA
jgi:hypothetical protein